MRGAELVRRVGTRLLGGRRILQRAAARRLQALPRLGVGRFQAGQVDGARLGTREETRVPFGNPREDRVLRGQRTRPRVRRHRKRARGRPVRGRLREMRPHAPEPSARRQNLRRTVHVARQARHADGFRELRRARVLEVVGPGALLRAPHERGRGLRAHFTFGGACAPFRRLRRAVVKTRRGDRARRGHRRKKIQSDLFHKEIFI